VAAGQRWRRAAPYAAGLAATGPLAALKPTFFRSNSPQKPLFSPCSMSQNAGFSTKKIGDIILSHLFNILIINILSKKIC
jgi:hypothetical protein